MKSAVTFLFIFFFACSLWAQKAELLKGRWKFSDVAEKEKLDSNTLKEALLIFSHTEIEFAPDGKYLWGNTPVGTWAMSEDESKVVITSGPNSTPMAIHTLTAKELRINMGKADLIMVHPTLPPPINPAECETYLDKELHKFGLKDKTGRILIAPKYELMTYNPREGLWIVELDKKWGFVNAVDKVIVPIKYDYAHPFIEGRAMVNLGGKYGFVDKTGKEIIPVKYTYVTDFSNGEAEVGLEAQSFIIDLNGNEVK